MRDLRYQKLIDILLGHSLALKEGEVDYIESFDVPDHVTCSLIERVSRLPAIPLVSQKSFQVLRKLFLYATEASMRAYGGIELQKVKAAQADIGIKAPANITEHADISEELWRLYRKYWL